MAGPSAGVPFCIDRISGNGPPGFPLTNRDLAIAVREGRFREDLLARINLWTFRLPALRDRPEDIEPNLEFELEQRSRRTRRSIRISREARERFLKFATSPAAAWSGNFRDLSAAVARMATLAAGGRITDQIVEAEVRRLRQSWGGLGAQEDVTSHDGDDPLRALLSDAGLEALDLFDRVQLAEVVRVCRGCASLSDAGRSLFAASRRNKAAPNDADRLRKYLARHGLTWARITGKGSDGTT